jgi:predicted transcriptional regulator
MLIILLISQVCYSNEIDNTTVDTIILKGKNCNIVVEKSQNNSFQYNYNNKLFELITKNDIIC